MLEAAGEYQARPGIHDTKGPEIVLPDSKH